MISAFPDFSPLTLDDKDMYDSLVAKYPIYSDISFSTLHIWWNLEDKLKISSLNNNLVFRYSQPFEPEDNGYCLVGKHEVDESIETVFKFLRGQHMAVRLVHVPEFVVDAIKDKARFEITEEPDYHEYILDSHALSVLEGRDHWRNRGKIKRFLREVEGRQIEIRSLELSSNEVKQDLIQNILKWEKTRNKSNDPERTESQAILNTINHAGKLNVENLSLYIDGVLNAVVLYHKSQDGKYFVIHHIKVDYSTPRIFDYMTHVLATKAKDDAVAFLNMEMDLGIESLREHKLGLRPVDFVKKYTISPA
ncbi:MAG: phosphatidylglycerol lysyltransferase domain-containing protein [Patescibacteria group bacterium]